MPCMRKHWMAIPLAVVAPFLVATVVLWKTQDWSDQAAGAVVIGLMSIACVISGFMAPKPLE